MLKNNEKPLYSLIIDEMLKYAESKENIEKCINWVIDEEIEETGFEPNEELIKRIKDIHAKSNHFKEKDWAYHVFDEKEEIDKNE